MEQLPPVAFVPLSLAEPIWDRVFTVAPLIIVGTRDPGGSYNLAPKHLAMPMSWENHFGFVCAPHHRTFQNIEHQQVFTVSFPRPTQTLLTSLTAGPRDEEGDKPALQDVPMFAAQRVDGMLLHDAYLCLECELDRIIGDLGPNCLIIGRIVAAQVAQDSLRTAAADDNEILRQAPLLVYLNWGRFGRIDESYEFPFLSGFSR